MTPQSPPTPSRLGSCMGGSCKEAWGQISPIGGPEGKGREEEGGGEWGRVLRTGRPPASPTHIFGKEGLLLLGVLGLLRLLHLQALDESCRLRSGGGWGRETG